MNKILTLLVAVLTVLTPLAFAQAALEKDVILEENTFQTVVSSDVAAPALQPETETQPAKKEPIIEKNVPAITLSEGVSTFAQLYGISVQDMLASVRYQTSSRGSEDHFMIGTPEMDKFLFGQYWDGKYWSGTMIWNNRLEGFGLGGYQQLGQYGGIWWGWFYWDPARMEKGGWFGGVYSTYPGEQKWWLWSIDGPVSEWHKGVLEGPAQKLFK